MSVASTLPLAAVAPTRPMASGTVLLLGPQREERTLAAAIEKAGIGGRIGVVTAGWEEREEEVTELQDHLGGRGANLSLFRRAESLYRRVPELDDLRQELLRERRQVRRLYGVRLHHIFDAWQALARRREEPELVAEQRDSLMSELRRLDEQHLLRIDASIASYREALGERFGDAIQRQRRELTRLLDDCDALAIAGGNAGSLLETLELFDIGAMTLDKPAIGWSAGAMALTERVVLYHDFPPQGVGNPEVLVRGLGRVRSLVALPHASTRLRLDDPARVGRFAQRFAPAVCATLDRGSVALHLDDRWHVENVDVLGLEGTLQEARW